MNTVTKGYKELHKVVTTEFPLPVDDFGDLTSLSLPHAIGVRMNPIDKIAEAYLTCDPATTKFVCARESLVTNSFMTAKLATDINQNFFELNEKNTPNDLRHVPIYLSVTFDDTNVDNKHSACPILMEILNFENTRDAKHMFIGLAPTFPISNEVLIDILRQKGCISNVLAEQKIKETKRKVFLEYFESLLRPILNFTECGFLMDIGGLNFDDTQQERVIAHPIIVVFPGYKHFRH